MVARTSGIGGKSLESDLVGACFFFATYAMVGAKLQRTKTLANGDECCNFHVTRMH